jgi:hypothetical protein
MNSVAACAGAIGGGCDGEVVRIGGCDGADVRGIGCGIIGIGCGCGLGRGIGGIGGAGDCAVAGGWRSCSIISFE